MTDACADTPVHVDTTTSCQALLRRRSLWQLFVVAFVAALLSKGGALLPGMAPDDYVFAVNAIPRSVIDVMIGQGRGLNAALAMALASLNAPLASIGMFVFIFACGTIAFAIAISISLIQDNGTNRMHDYIACVFAATHPYLTSYFLFRMNLFNMALIYAALPLTLLLLVYHRRLWQLAACAVLVAVFCQLSQIIVILFAVSAGAWSLNRFCRARANGAHLRVAADGIIATLIVLVAALVLYEACSTALRTALHIPPFAAYTLHLSTGILGALGTAFKLVFEVLLAGESINPLWLKAWVLVVVLASVAACLARKPLYGAAALVLLVGGLLATVSPLALSWGGLVPRTFSPAGLCLALVFCLACNAIHVRASHVIAIVLTVPLLCFCLIGASLFYQQALLTRWDQDTAAAIFQRVRTQATPGAPIRIAAAWPIYREQLDYDGPGIDESAFLYDWAYPGLFQVATGVPVNVIAGNPRACEHVPAWPDPTSTRRLPDGSTLVCMIHGLANGQGAAQ